MPDNNAPICLTTAKYLPGDLPLRVTFQYNHGEFPFHTHEFWEIAVILQGHGYHDFQDRTVEIRAGDVFVVSHNQAHRYRDTTNMTVVDILYHPEALPYSMAAFEQLPGYQALFVIEPQFRTRGHIGGHLHLQPDQLAFLRAHLEDMNAELTARVPGYQLILPAMMTELIITLSRWYASSTTRPARPLLLQGNLHSYLLRRLATQLTVSQMAEQLHISSRTLQRQCQDILGMSPIQYLNALRIREACRLLCETDLPVTDIASQVGFADLAYFSRQFRKAHTVSPRSYRQAHQK